MGFFSVIGAVLDGVNNILEAFGGQHVESVSGSYTSSDGSSGTYSSDTYDYGDGHQKKYTTYTDSNGNSKTYTEDIHRYN